MEVHHIWPLGHGGPDELANLVSLCANGHGAIHDLIARELKARAAGVQLSWAARRRYGRRVRALAQRGVDAIEAARARG